MAIMSFTLILAMAALFGLAVVFVIALVWKGMKTALISTGVALVVFAVLFLAIIALVVSSMN